MTRSGPDQPERVRRGGPAPRARLVEVIEPVAERAGVELERLTVTRAGRRHLVRVIIDGDGGVSLDQVAEVSRACSAALDAAERAGQEVVPGEYVLEVSSPGVDRPLTEPRHWRRNVRRLVTVAVTENQTTRHLTGRIMAVSAAGVVLDVDGSTRELPYERMGPGRIQVEFQRLDQEPDQAEEALGGEELGGERE